ncbi:SMP-30/gluconolactonase/LRE family protein [Glaciibacter superstes]|uniref:SMP-30/gluconolactonase/LRE family protein n=1 Tax=Glaciibacter superstes TaxID=501023 RepID=UPI0003B6C6F1|nr:SMP-30/gluconolactonase/LRE family protein [Glaciibacter superstes]
MDSLLAHGAKLEKLFTGTTWAEGPVWLPETQSVRWSDIPRDRIMEYNSVSGETRVHRSAVEYTNGRTLDRGGSVVQCCHGRRSIEREVDGVVETLVDRWEGHRFNSPNDIVVASNGTIWFTDPPYGILSDVEGHQGEQEYGGCWVFCFDPATDVLTPVITDMIYPNGLAFSPDETILYVSDTSSGDVPNGQCHIRAYDVDVASATTSNGRVFSEVRPGCPDGFRVDVDGRIWTSSEDSVQVLSVQGEVLERIPVPEKVANLCFGGEDGRDLYVTATTSLYRIRTTTTQAPRPAR